MDQQFINYLLSQSGHVFGQVFFIELESAGFKHLSVKPVLESC